MVYSYLPSPEGGASNIPHALRRSLSTSRSLADFLATKSAAVRAERLHSDTYGVSSAGSLTFAALATRRDM